MTVVFVITGVILMAAAFLTAYRLLRGPNTLDRVVAVDALVAIAVGGLAVWAAYSRNSSVIPGIVALSLIGFVGSVSVVRFRVPDDAGTAPSPPDETPDIAPRNGGLR
ncbi:MULTISPECIES: monovalent cation/H+ antiporter complex subunit F [Tsukamurella]|uniref:Multisubunit sodium/proton antiporter, MrpF subunit n=2 Tax=Tsukamurella TaxID=2060 RepID=A0A1H5ALZ5_TSUTY|nr:MULTISPECIES: monovalent cation/H+ antiporter complex subunit F [Tsukamurella]AUN42218.1 cation:proton antiporter [Tsukamurella tyrosinosolvens]KXO95296.1 cation:proton antiporter [Tsukamurella tyrosinosolvens]KXP07480.1 cation:proton antiporter [Tsukamurella tyrosinosolvens]KZL98682.1 cation:proton antiporter [Tsukamurella tyrosinosolvens]MCA4994898.1 cation:proton antiporter [Tsukamurella tyrosinosolvens]